MEALISDHRWQALEELLSLQAPLSVAKMTLNASILGVPEDSEDARQVRDIWKDPRCLIICS